MQSQTLIKIVAIISVITLNLYGAIIPEVVSSNLSLPAGVHTISNSTIVSPGILLSFSAPSTVQVVSASGKIEINGSLEADGTLFAGDGEFERWGQILINEGSTCDIKNCTLSYGCSTNYPAQPISNAMFFAKSASVVISNTSALKPNADSFAFQGGSIVFVNNHAETINRGSRFNGILIAEGADSPTRWYSRDNTVDTSGGGMGDIVLDGEYNKDIELLVAENDKFRFIKVIFSNSVLSVNAGINLGFNSLDSKLTLKNKSKLVLAGTSTEPVLVNDCNLNTNGASQWEGLHFYSGSTGMFTWANIERGGSHIFDNSFLVMSNSHLKGKGVHAIYATSTSEIYVSHSSISKYGGGAVQLFTNSSAIFTKCSFYDNNPPFSDTLTVDDTSSADVRFCWWSSADGPYPFGPHGNEIIITNANIKCFPWLIAAPGSQIDPPSISITDPSSEPAVVSGPQILLRGTATDKSKITRIEYKNLASGVTGVASLNDSSWEANCWLFEGLNQIGLTVYDDEGNAAVAGIIVDCTGSGVGNGGTKTPVLNPLPDRVVPEYIPLTIGVAAYSPEPSILTYWAENLPVGATFNQITREFSWDLPVEGTYDDILFFVTDGKFVVSNSVNITVVASDEPPVNILTKKLPDAYKYNKYYILLSIENAIGSVEWTLVGNISLPDGLVLSRSGILSGVPTDQRSKSVSINVKATDSRGSDYSSTTTLSFNYNATEPSDELRIPTQPLPFCVKGTTYNTQLFATNGAGTYDFSEASAVLNSIGLSISNNGTISGTVNSDVMVPWAALVTAETNISAIANLVIPAIKPEEKLELVPGKNMLKLIIKQSSTTLAKSKIIFKATLTPPADFILDESSIVTAMIGVNQIDGKLVLSSVLNKKILFKRKVGFMSEKILVKKLGDGNLKAMFILKNVDLSKSFVDWGLKNEDLLVPTSFDVPIFIRIGDGYTVNEVAPTMVKSKFNKISKGKAKW